MAYDIYQDPNQAWYGDPYGYEGYGYDDQEEYREEDTESQKLRKEQEMIEAIESNRLYLRKFRIKCVQEDFADLEKAQMFLFEFLIESLEANTQSELGLVSETDETSELVARVQFLDTPYLEIREKGEKIEGGDSVQDQTEYFETVGNVGLYDAYDPAKPVGTNNDGNNNGSQGGSVGEDEAASDDQPKNNYDTQWANSSGKSLLFSKPALEILQGLDKSPVRVQISMCKEPAEDDERGTCEPLGYASIRLPEHFNLSVLQSCKPGVILPVSCVHRVTCELRNVFGVKKGELQVFVRLSCFGSVITTSFQSVGPDRRYVFKPSPLPEMEGETESEVNRDAVLKPIVAEEEVAKGITITKDEDIFQRTVVWKNNQINCGCLDNESGLDVRQDQNLRMPRPSDNSLCRDAIAPQSKQGKPLCDWHKLVTKEIQNNPGGNCGCLDGVSFGKSPQSPVTTTDLKTTCCLEEPNAELKSNDKLSRSHSKPSRIIKLQLKTQVEEKPLRPSVAEKAVLPVKGLGMKPEPVDCNCDCPSVRISLAKTPMMKNTWQAGK